MNDGTYWEKDENGIKIYYLKYQKIGVEFDAVRFFILTGKISSSNAHKLVRKIKELKVKNEK
jgi:hypothetical protein